ncbi:carbohydrate ABC transporter permease [Ruminococcaceae bacterium OttesenSCG-928-I18]|nr:carbohydrate ABC transporter permease [Ruminococcaceae bacterium OttesenSCG-928-I18]
MKKRQYPLAWVIVLLYLAFTLVPYLWLVSTSLKPESQAVKIPLEVLPSPATTENYEDVLNVGGHTTAMISTRVDKALANTLIVSFSATFLALLVGMPAAYSFAKYRFRGSRPVFIAIIIARMFPVITLAIPLYQLFRGFHLHDTKIGLILAYTALTLPFTIWMLYSFFRDLPDEVEEAARIDGCGFFRMFLRVILPISAPGITATFILTLIYPWNDLLLNTILSSSIQSQTISSALLQFNTTYQIFWSHLAAGAVLASLPALILTLLLQKVIVQGLTLGAVKG